MNCPNCSHGVSLDDATNSHGKSERAQAGNVLVCAHCTLPMLFDGTNVRVPSLSELKRLPWEVLEKIGEMQEVVRAVKARIN